MYKIFKLLVYNFIKQLEKRNKFALKIFESEAFYY